jgi:hypothetical protein
VVARQPAQVSRGHGSAARQAQARQYEGDAH